MQPDPTHTPPHEYSDERDMDAFWRCAEAQAEPARKRWYVPLIVLLVLFSVPWYFSEGHLGRIVAGLPVWIWISLGCSFALAVTTAVGALRYWREQDEDRR